jgi:hypothetical protein
VLVAGRQPDEAGAVRVGEEEARRSRCEAGSTLEDEAAVGPREAASRLLLRP